MLKIWNDMNFLEKDLEQILWETDSKKIEERGLYGISGIKKRQLRVGNYGVLDLVTIKRLETPHGIKYLSITVFELKKDLIDVHTFLQAVRYCKGIISYLEKRNRWEFELNIVLVGKSIEKQTPFVFLTDMFQGNDFANYSRVNSVNFFTYSYDFDGIKFHNHSDYKMTNEGF